MNARCGAFLALVVLGVSASLLWVDGGRAASPAARSLVLLPATLGGRHVLERWDNPLAQGTLEEGAVYGGPANVPAVQLDFYRNSPRRHNGAGCYAARGESVLWDRPRVLATLAGRTQFDVVLLRGLNQLRIVAATECAATGCSESGIGGELNQGTQVRLLDMQGRRWSFVPVSVVIVRTVLGTQDEDAVGAEMQHDLEAVLREIDLTPAEKLAALQAAQ